jgi:hypothetical protein
MMLGHLDIAGSPWQTLTMRTTLSIDDDVLAVAKHLARTRSESVGRVLSDLARRGLHATSRATGAGTSGFPVFQVPPDAHPITLDDVKRIEDEM